MKRAGRGFDCVVGNPPFLGGSKISTAHSAAYVHWLLTQHKGAHGNGDLVAHFFRRAFVLLRKGGTFGLIATNTIAEGDTRTTGLAWVVRNGGVIYEATRRCRWPGLAAVIVSIVSVAKAPPKTPAPPAPRLDGKRVNRISAFLFAGSTDDSPTQLRANAERAFLGAKIYGQGFTFDDNSPGATPLAVMKQLITNDRRNAERIFAYLGGEELNTSPTQAPHRYVINFGQMALDHAEQWPDLMQIVREKVKPERDCLREDTGPGAHGKKWWWQFQHPRSELNAAIHALPRVLANSQVSAHHAFAFQPTDRVFSHALNVFALSEDAAFAILQSRPHELWARFFGSTLEDRLRYTASDCFETFPFPPDWESNAALEAAGKTYYDFRAALMVRNDQGLTATYNRFHDPEERDADIQKLRELHAAMDRAVLDAYGWTDLEPTCAFLLDYEEEESDEDEGGKRRKKKPWRYRWPDELRDEVLARLIALNQERAEHEAAMGGPARRG